MLNRPHRPTTLRSPRRRTTPPKPTIPCVRKSGNSWLAILTEDEDRGICAEFPDVSDRCATLQKPRFQSPRMAIHGLFRYSINPRDPDCTDITSVRARHSRRAEFTVGLERRTHHEPALAINH